MPSKPWLGGIKAFMIRNRVEIIAAGAIIICLIVAAIVVIFGGVEWLR